MGLRAHGPCAALASLALGACWLTASYDALLVGSDAGADAFSPIDAASLDGASSTDGSLADAPSTPDARADADAATDATAADAAPPTDAGCLADSYVASVLAESPVAYWRLDDAPPSTIAKDLTGHYDGTYQGGVTLGAPGALANDTAAAFDGNTGLVRVGADPAFDGVKPFSLEAWINPAADAGGFRGIASNESTTQTNRSGFLLFADPSTGDVGFERWAAGSSNPTLATGVPNGAWTHVVGAFDGTKLVLYVNGVVANTYTAGGIVQIPQAYTFVIGALFSGGQSTSFGGAIDEVAVYAQPLDPRCVLAHYHLGRGEAP